MHVTHQVGFFPLMGHMHSLQSDTTNRRLWPLDLGLILENRRDLVAILQCKYSVTAMMTSLSWDTSHTLVDEENIMMVRGFGPALPLKTFSKALIRRHYLLSSSDQSKFGSCAAIYRDYFQPLSFSGRAFILLLWHLSHPSLTITRDISPVCPPNAVFHSLISIWRLFRSR